WSDKQNNLQAIANDFRASIGRCMVGDIHTERLYVRPNDVRNRSWNIRFFRKIQLCFDHSAGMYQLLPPFIIELPVLAGGVGNRETTLCLSFSRNKIRKSLSICQVKLTVEISALCKLTCFSRTKPGHGGQGFQKFCHHGFTTMHLKLR